jgi:imidazoleglycerol phosphate dehydratase HisB
MQISIEGIKTKPSNGFEFRCLLQVCFSKDEMTTITTQLLPTFFKILAYGAEIALHITTQNPNLEKRHNRQRSVNGVTGQGCP